jgi:putative SOS response-associated peptidase YedK
MCRRFVQYSDPEIYAGHFDLDVICQASPPYNVAPTQPVLAIRSTDEGQRELLPLRWDSFPPGPRDRTAAIK